VTTIVTMIRYRYPKVGNVTIKRIN